MVDDLEENVDRNASFEDDLLLRGLKAGFADENEETPILSPRRPTLESIRRHPAIRCLSREGRYVPVGILGHGGMGLVVEVEDTFIRRRVALKVMRRLSDAAENAAGPLFLEEARTAAGLDHPGIVPVLDVGLAEGRYPWFTMPIVRGRTFAEIIRENADDAGRRDAIGVVGRIAEAIAHAHHRGVVHGDLKPSNVMIGSLGEVLVMDWGLSRSRGKEKHDGAAIGIGTPGYMAPEQARGATEAIGPRTDVYALGAILHTIVAGEPPSMAVPDAPMKGDVASANSGARESKREASAASPFGKTPTSSSKIDPSQSVDRIGLSEALARLIRECLAHSPSDRPADAGCVAERLQSIARAETEKARSDAFLLVRTRAEAEHHKRRKLWLLGLLVAVVVAAAATIQSIVARSDRLIEIERRTRSAVSALDRAVTVDDESVGQSTDRRIESLLAAKSHIVTAERLIEIGEIDPKVAEAIAARSRRIAKELEIARAAKSVADARADFFVRIKAARLRYLEVGRHTESEADFSDAFAKLRWSPTERNPEEIGAEIRKDAAAAEIVEALHLWLLAHLGSASTRRRRSPELQRLIVAADPDRERSEVLRRMIEGNIAAHELDDASIDRLPPSTVHLLADGAARDGHRDRAFAMYRRGLIRHPGDYWLRFGLGYRMSEGSSDEELAEAEAAFATCVGISPESARAHANLGIVLSRRGDTARAAQALEKSLSLDPKDRWALFGAGVVALREKRFAEALAFFEECEKIGAPDPEWLIVHKCRTLIELDRVPEAVAIAGEARKSFPTDPRFLGTRLAAFERSKNEAAALAEIDEFLKAAPKSAPAYLELAKIHGRANRRAEMIDALRRAFDLDAKNSSAAFMLGMNLSNAPNAETDDLREAERALDRAVDLLPKNDAARKRRGIVRKALANFDGAVADLEFAAAAEKRAGGGDETVALLETARKDLATMRKIRDVLDGKTLPSSSGAWKDLLTFCATKRIFRTESELWRRALDRTPPVFDDPAGREIFHAARSAVRSLSNIGIEQRAESDAAVEIWWTEAADRFVAGAERLSASIDRGTITPATAAEVAGHWAGDGDLRRLLAHFPDGHPKKSEVRDTFTRLETLSKVNSPSSRPVR